MILSLSTMLKTGILRLSRNINIHGRWNRCMMQFDSFQFPGGERHIRIQKAGDYDRVIIAASVQSSNTLFDIILANDAIKRANPDTQVELLMPYVPYARQDRVMVPNEPLSVKVAADLINSQKFHRVHLMDPHSTVTPALYDNVKVIDHSRFVRNAFDSIMDNYGAIDGVVSPDAGAEKRINEVLTKLNVQTNILQCTKQRDLRTGRIVNYEIDGRYDIKNAQCVIIDDIIDGGGTFITLGKMLKERGVKRVHLIVTHGIFSKGYDELLKYVDSVHVTDSLKFESDGNGKVVTYLGTFDMAFGNSKYYTDEFGDGTIEP